MQTTSHIEAATGPEIHTALTGHRLAEVQRTPAALAPTEKLLLTAAESAALLGISLRLFHYKRPALPDPVAITSRHMRWRRTDLVRWVADLASAPQRHEPAQLKVAKAARKGTPGASAAEPHSPARKTQETRGSQLKQVPSNPETTAHAAARE